ncbi:MAG: autotransporter assembly complex family protein [Caulobacterales bacterium]
MRRSPVAAFASLALLCLILAPQSAVAADFAKARVQGVMDRALRLEVQRAIGVTKSRPTTRIDARRRARDAGESVIAVLRSEGYYDYLVEPDVGEGDTPDPLVRITLGPRSTFAPPKLVWDGPPPDDVSATTAEMALALPPGGPGRAADVLAAEGRAVSALQKRGFADAAARPRQVVVDHADHSVEPTFNIAAGELVHMDGLKVVTEGRTNPAWVATLASWKKGSAYNPDKVAQLEQRLRDVGVYSSVTVSLATADQAVNGLRPVVVSLGDRPPHTIELGADYSTSEGAGVDAKWILYNRLRRADTLTLTARLAQIQQKLDVELDLPDWRRGDQTLKLGADIFSDLTKGYDDAGLGLRADVERHWTKTTYLTLGAAFDIAETREKTAINVNGLPVGQTLKLAIPSLLAAFALDRSNDPLNPTRGWRLQAQAEPTFITGDRTLAYVKVQAQVSGYLPLKSDASTVLAGRIKFGSILGGNIPTVPSDRRFFAGGGGSIRGYNYQGVGLKLSDGTPVGGASLFESSFEVRQKVVGPWSMAAFIDAGALGQDVMPDFRQIAVGAGLGVRYNLGFAPIRVDIATPLDRHKGDPILQLYLSIGQSF